jgi:CubicO group peptidase (beta-lactamase class C family)
MYGASLTKAAFGYLVMQLVEEGRLGLDVPLRRLPAAALAQLHIQ